MDGRPHWSGSFKFKGPQGGLFPEAPTGESQPAKEFAGLSVWQPHTKVNTQRVKRVLSLGGLFWGASGSLPPSLGSFLWGFPFSALKVPRDDRGRTRMGTNRRTGQRQVPHSALYSASSTVRSLLSVHTLLRVSSSRTRSSSRSSPLCWSVFCSLQWWRQSATLPQTVAPVIVLGLFDHCASVSGALEASSKKHDRMRARHFGFEES